MQDLDITKIFKMLPCKEQLDDLIQQDSIEIAKKIQDDLLAKVINGRGVAETKMHIDPQFRERVYGLLKKWVKLYKYDIVFYQDSEVYYFKDSSPCYRVCIKIFPQKSIWERFNMWRWR